MYLCVYVYLCRIHKYIYIYIYIYILWVWGPGAQRQSKKARKRRARKTPNHATPGKHPTANEESKRRKQDAEGTGEQRATHEAKQRTEARSLKQGNRARRHRFCKADGRGGPQGSAEGPRLQAKRAARRQGVCTGTMADAFTVCMCMNVTLCMYVCMSCYVMTCFMPRLLFVMSCQIRSA